MSLKEVEVRRHGRIGSETDKRDGEGAEPAQADVCGSR